MWLTVSTQVWKQNLSVFRVLFSFFTMVKY